MESWQPATLKSRVIICDRRRSWLKTGHLKQLLDRAAVSMQYRRPTSRSVGISYSDRVIFHHGKFYISRMFRGPCGVDPKQNISIPSAFCTKALSLLYLVCSTPYRRLQGSYKSRAGRYPVGKRVNVQFRSSVARLTLRMAVQTRNYPGQTASINYEFEQHGDVNL